MLGPPAEVVADHQIVHSRRPRRLHRQQSPLPGKGSSELSGGRPRLGGDGDGVIVGSRRDFRQGLDRHRPFQQRRLRQIGRGRYHPPLLADLLRLLVRPDLQVERGSRAPEVHVRLTVVVIPVARLVLAGVLFSAGPHVPADGIVTERGARHGVVHAAAEDAERHALLVPVEGELVFIDVVQHELAAHASEVRFLRGP